MSGPTEPRRQPGAEQPERATYPRVLLRVMVVQVITLLLLWLLQAHFGG